MRVRFWGVRGSTPTPQRENMGYGGNTSCIEIRTDNDQILIFDGGTGIKQVDVSTDGGKSWKAAKLGKDLGNYSFREWTLPVKLSAGVHELKVRATSNGGKVQPEKAVFNPAGYMRNVIETTSVTVA